MSTTARTEAKRFEAGRALRVFSLLVGAGDTLTGCLLVTVPLTTLRLMRIAAVPAEPVYLRFIGVFVAAVGIAYLYPFLLGAERLAERLRTAFEITAIARLGVAFFVTASVVGGALTPGWLMVAAFDGLVAVAQIALLGRAGRAGRIEGGR